MYTTTQLTQQLGISRNWINQHLRSLGYINVSFNGKTKVRCVCYEEKALMEWINANATFARQTIQLPFDYFGLISDDEAADRMDEINLLYNRKSIYWDEVAFEKERKLYRAALPPEWHDPLENKYTRSNRRRGKNPWVDVDYTISRLGELHTVAALMQYYNYNSTEMLYREIFCQGWIRATIDGRCWYIREPLREEFAEKTMMMLPMALLAGA